MRIVLVEPEIPQNTGNISRTCAATGMSLHLIEPLGFSIDEKHVRRAGLDYWQYLDLHVHPSFEDFLEKFGDEPIYYLSTKAPRAYSQANFEKDCTLVFGKETKGLPEELLAKNYDRCFRIPMLPGIRSLNLSNSVAIVAYEALRQNGFSGMLEEGRLTTIDMNGAQDL